MPFTPPAHSPYSWSNSPSTATPLDSAHLQAAETDLINYSQAVTAAYDTYLQAGQPVNVKYFGAVGDGVTDDTAAFVAALTAVKARANNVGARIKIPAGVYNCPTWPAAGLTWNDRCIIWEGDGSSTLYPGSGTVIKFPAGSKGFNPKNGTGSGSRSGFLRLHLLGQDVSAGTNQGILMQCNEGIIDDVVVDGFGGANVHLLSGIGTADPTINTNLCRIRHLRVFNSKSDGLRIEGIDSNVTLVDGLDASQNAGWGCYDLAFLTNTLVAPHFYANVLGDYRVGAGAGGKRIFGGYWEDGNSIAVQFDAGTYGCLVDGGTLGNQPTGNLSRINDLTAGSGGHEVTQVLTGYSLKSEINVGNNQSGRLIALQSAQQRIALLKGSAILFEDPTAAQWWTDAVVAGGHRVIQNINGPQFGNFNVLNALKVAGGARIYSGSGVPGATSAPGGASPAVGDIYVRIDGGGGTKTNLYFCTVAGGTWVGIA